MLERQHATEIAGSPDRPTTSARERNPRTDCPRADVRMLRVRQDFPGRRWTSTRPYAAKVSGR
ncbi:hypothetical protein TRAPUB_8641 [Trametes pubescens]|uniref:Uncharacterized protein n=1 Tax=Trametes pubescens TaxID=154538 RepID=A0A1M2W4K3_TRAPU|nr:hypothetical protein TRAPUB_8641 [Trametes pubescens]